MDDYHPRTNYEFCCYGLLYSIREYFWNKHLFSSSLTSVKLPWKKDQRSDEHSQNHGDSHASANATEAINSSEGDIIPSKAFTPKKGRPTPKRNEVERQQGTRRSAYTAPQTPAEARKARKELKASMSKEEYKALKKKERERAAAERRKINERMLAGDEKYLLARDQGPERKLVRDWVDAHRYITNYFMPMALVVILLMIIGTRNPQFANAVSLFMMFILIIMFIEGFFLGRKVNSVVRAAFPHTTETGFRLGLYAFTRATMIRRLRTPAPQVNIGDM